MSQIHNLHEYSLKENQSILLGQGGTKIITTGGSPISTPVGDWVAFTILTEDTRVIMTPHDPAGHSPGMGSVLTEFEVGTTYYGYWKSIVVVNLNVTVPTDFWATIICYRASLDGHV